LPPASGSTPAPPARARCSRTGAGRRRLDRGSWRIRLPKPRPTGQPPETTFRKRDHESPSPGSAVTR
jgi:hypothetical protein